MPPGRQASENAVADLSEWMTANSPKRRKLSSQLRCTGWTVLLALSTLHTVTETTCSCAHSFKSPRCFELLSAFEHLRCCAGTTSSRTSVGTSAFQQITTNRRGSYGAADGPEDGTSNPCSCGTPLAALECCDLSDLQRQQLHLRRVWCSGHL